MVTDIEFGAWKKHMRAGNDCFNKYQTLTAISHYNEAAYRAQRLINTSRNKSGAIAALIAAYHNLAEVYGRTEEYELCEETLRAPMQTIDQLLIDYTEDSSTYCAALHGKNMAYCALLQFQKERSAPYKVASNRVQPFQVIQHNQKLN